MSVIIDRRSADDGRSVVDRERFMRRYERYVRKAIDEMTAGRGVTDMAQGGRVRIPAGDVREPRFTYGQGGDREFVHPGNRTFVAGDRIPRQAGGGAGEGAGGTEGAGNGLSTDDIAFTLSREEFLRLFLADLALPNLDRMIGGPMVEKRLVRAGYRRQGSPATMHVGRSLRSALERRIAIRGALEQRLAALDDAPPAATSDDADPEAIRERIRRIAFLDEVDLRFRNRTVVEEPLARAVMFCLMDVSGSMDERKKDLAKRFYTLLYLFLQQHYEQVEVVFVRHTDSPEEVTEEEFFSGNRSGGTVVLSALEMVAAIIDARFSPARWNVYVAQASDGDTFGADPVKSRQFLEQKLLPATRHYAYVEIPDYAGSSPSALWHAYSQVTRKHFARQRVLRREDIYPVFRELFRKESAHA